MRNPRPARSTPGANDPTTRPGAPPSSDGSSLARNCRSMSRAEMHRRAYATTTETLSWADLDGVLDAVVAQATNLSSPIHGPVHWHSVAVASLYLLEAGAAADRA